MHMYVRMYKHRPKHCFVVFSFPLRSETKKVRVVWIDHLMKNLHSNQNLINVNIGSSRITTLDVGKARNERTAGQGKSSHELNPKILRRPAQPTLLLYLWVVVASSTHKS